MGGYCQLTTQSPQISSFADFTHPIQIFGHTSPLSILSSNGLLKYDNFSHSSDDVVVENDYSSPSWSTALQRYNSSPFIL